MKIFLALLVLMMAVPILTNTEQTKLNEQDDVEAQMKDQQEQQRQPSKKSIKQLVQAQEEIQEMTKNIYYSCIIVSRHYLNSGDGVIDQLKQISSAYDDVTDKKERQDKELLVWKRIYIDTVLFCGEHQNPSGAMKVYQELQSGSFDPRPFFPLVQNMNYVQFMNKQARLEFSTEEEALWGMMKEFEERIKANNKQTNEHQDDDEDDVLQRQSRAPLDYSDYEPKVFGISTKSDSKTFQLLIMLGVFGIFGVVIAFSLKVVSGEEQPKKKAKKSKKEKDL